MGKFKLWVCLAVSASFSAYLGRGRDLWECPRAGNGQSCKISFPACSAVEDDEARGTVGLARPLEGISREVVCEADFQREKGLCCEEEGVSTSMYVFCSNEGSLGQ